MPINSDAKYGLQNNFIRWKWEVRDARVRLKRMVNFAIDDASRFIRWWELGAVCDVNI